MKMKINVYFVNPKDWDKQIAFGKFGKIKYGVLGFNFFVFGISLKWK